MKRILAILGILILAFVGYVWFVYFRGGKGRPKGPKPVSLAVSKHSDSFNQSIQSILDTYYSMSEGFVSWDTLAINKNASSLKISLDNLKIDELKADTTGIYESVLDPLANTKIADSIIIHTPSITDKHVAFNDLSQNLRLVLIVVKYDAAKIYWQECPTALGDDKPGNWLSKTDAVRNPYMGLKDPKYQDKMLDCGGPKDTINFMIANTTHRFGN